MNVLPVVDKSSGGRYKCRADNRLDSPIETEFQIHVLGMTADAWNSLTFCDFFCPLWDVFDYSSQNEALHVP